MHRRAGVLIDRFAQDGLGRLLGEMPGKERIAEYLQRRARRELAKQSPEQLEQYLRLLVGLMDAIRTGEHFNEFTEPPAKEPAA